MNFTPRPTGSFQEFIDAYFERCRARVPEIEANAGKWCHEDLIPGLSDFDTRFIVRDGMTADDWCRMSAEVGRTHLELARERPDWARNLEHLPGINLQWSELLDPAQYSPEFAKWSFYRAPAGRIEAAAGAIASHRWSEADDTYHWKTIAVYYGPYDRSIDPPVNLGAYENKYPLHSRLLHYFAPPVHAAVCLWHRKTTPGKLEAFRTARELFPDGGAIDFALEVIERHYELPELLREPGVSELDRRLETYLTRMVDALLHGGSRLRCPPSPAPGRLREAVQELKGSTPLGQLFENIKFARLMKGRLWFYGQYVPWFDSRWLIQNELKRIRRLFYEAPLRLFARHVLDVEATAERALEMIEGDVLTREQAGACRRFAELSRAEGSSENLKTKSLAVADCFDPFLHALEALLQRTKGALGG